METYTTPSGRWTFEVGAWRVNLGGFMLGVIKFVCEEPIGQQWEFHDTGSLSFACGGDKDEIIDTIGHMIDQSLEGATATPDPRRGEGGEQEGVPRCQRESPAPDAVDTGVRDGGIRHARPAACRRIARSARAAGAGTHR